MINSAEHTMLRRQEEREREEEEEEERRKDPKSQFAFWKQTMPSQDKWDCIKQLSAVAQVNV